MANKALMKCPFCNGEANFYWREMRYGSIVWVECETCGAKSKAFSMGDDLNGFVKAGKAWERRVNGQL